MFFKKAVTQKLCDSKTPMLQSLFERETPTQLFSCEYCKIFESSFSFIEHLRWLLFFQCNMVTAGHLPTLWDVRCEKTQCEMVPTKKVCRSSYEYVLDILLVETVPTRFCWLTCRKQKLVDSKTLQERLFACCQDFDSLGRFLSILNVYLTDMQINRWLHLSRSL